MFDRRTLLRGTGVLGLGLALGACSYGAPAPAGPTGPGTPAARTVAHAFGETSISGIPQRVVTVGLTEQDYLLALGVVPVGVREWFGGQPGALWPWALERAGGAVPAVLPTAELDFEQIVGLAPDLILGVSGGLLQVEYDRLAQIAPTVAHPAEYAAYGAPWQVIAERIGAALGRPDDAAALIPPIEDGFARVRAANPQFDGRTGLLATLIGGTFYVYAEGPAPRFLTDLGLTPPPAAQALFTGPDRAPVALSREQLAVLESDVLVVGLYGPEAATGRIDDPLYGGLSVVRRGGVVLLPELSRTNGALSFGSVLSLPVALEEMAPRIATALDGDPATVVPSAA